MSFTFTADYVIVAGIAFLLGMIITVLAYGGTRRRIRELTERVRALELDIDVREAEKVRLNRELAAAHDQVRPLSDEVDRLRIERDRRKAAAVVPVTETAPLIVPAADGTPIVTGSTSGDDNLTMMKGVGDRFATKLNELGITRFRQIADWSAAEEEAIDAQLGSFRGRLARDRVAEQARLLADGRITEFEARFGKLGE